MCGCDRASMVSGKAPDRASLDFDVVDTLPKGCHKACSDLDTGKVMVDRKYFQAWPRHAQDFALAHEVAHQSGADCESCADHVAGAVMRRWGWSKHASLDAASTVITNRALSRPSVEAGWNAASHASLDIPWKRRSKPLPARYASKSPTKGGTTTPKRNSAGKTGTNASTSPIATASPAAPVSTGTNASTSPIATASPVAPLPNEMPGQVPSVSPEASNGNGFGGQLLVAVVAGIVLWIFLGDKA